MEEGGHPHLRLGRRRQRSVARRAARRGNAHGATANRPRGARELAHVRNSGRGDRSERLTCHPGRCCLSCERPSLHRRCERSPRPRSLVSHEGRRRCHHSGAMDALSAFSARDTLCLTRRDLLVTGVSPRAIASSVHAGVVVRARRGVYCPASAPRHVIRALRVGGLAACTTAAETFGFWVPENRITEVWLPHQASRLRSPDSRRLPLAHADRARLSTHWKPLMHPAAASSWRVGAQDAILQVLGCLPRELAIAVLDSALAAGAVGGFELDAVAGRLSARRRPWLALEPAQVQRHSCGWPCATQVFESPLKSGFRAWVASTCSSARR